MKTLGNNTQNNIINNIKEYTIRDKVNENDTTNVSLKKYWKILFLKLWRKYNLTILISFKKSHLLKKLNKNNKNNLYKQGNSKKYIYNERWHSKKLFKWVD